jgi:hypothetical protein
VQNVLVFYCWIAVLAWLRVCLGWQYRLEIVRLGCVMREGIDNDALQFNVTQLLLASN